MKKYVFFLCCSFSMQLYAQTQEVHFLDKRGDKKIDVVVGGRYFSSFIFPSSLEKPVLYPIQAANGAVVTRGFPLDKRDGERTDHPHHVGLWFNYESVNGLDFWNNSYNIPAEKKSKYGWIRNVKVLELSKGKSAGKLVYTANWEKQDGTVLLVEKTELVFSGTENSRTIDRYTTLTAQRDTVHFNDVKDGLLGIRVTKELELPSDKTEKFSDSQGNVTEVSPTKNGANGNYLTSAGKRGNAAWGTRGNWCLLYGVKDRVPVSIAMIDHPKNPGYPTYWHARDYGLFAANPLGQKVFSEGKQELRMHLAPGASATFRYRVKISSGTEPTAASLNAEAADFARK
nr:PmoA family protein [Pedobacter sp. ASV19]